MSILYCTTVQLRDNVQFYSLAHAYATIFVHSTIQLSSAQSGSLTKKSIHVYQNSVESFVKQREVVFEVRMYTFIEFSIRLSLGLNSYVHRSAVSAPKSKDEHS